MDLVRDLEARGLIEQASADAGKILGEKRTVYLGVDPTADSMHAGNLLVVLFMKRLADAGHSIVLLVGGGTGMIGDPRESGERTLSDPKTVRKNKRALRAQMQQIIGKRVRLVDNADWLLKLKLVDFLRDIGKHFTINELIKRDIIKRRIENPDDSISYTEFAYSLLQGYDYLVLNQKYKVDLQIGASDQWTNILSGVDLIRKKLGREAYAITTPLVVDDAGKKFGKSEGNAIWLDAKKTSPYAFYQFWYRQPDSMVEKYLMYYTFMGPAEIEALVYMHQQNPERRMAQKTLAEEVTKLVHGVKAMHEAEKISEVEFGNASADSLTPAERKVYEASVTHHKVAPGASIIEAFVESGLVSSKGEARRLLEGKGLKINGETLTGDRAFTDDDFKDGFAQLQKGKTSKIRVVR